MDDIYDDLLPEDWRDDPAEYLKESEKVIKAVVNEILKIKEPYRFSGQSVTVCLSVHVAKKAVELMKDRIKKVKEIKIKEQV